MSDLYKMQDMISENIKDIITGIVTRSQYEYDFFISFSSKNISEAAILAHGLEEYGLRMFMSNQTMRSKAGDSYFEKIGYALKQSNYLILICTPEAMQSEWVKTEYETFHNEYFLPDPASRKLFIYKGRNFSDTIIPNLLRRLQLAASAADIVDSFLEVHTNEIPVVKQSKNKVILKKTAMNELITGLILIVLVIGGLIIYQNIPHHYSLYSQADEPVKPKDIHPTGSGYSMDTISLDEQDKDPSKFQSDITTRTIKNGDIFDDDFKDNYNDWPADTTTYYSRYFQTEGYCINNLSDDYGTASLVKIDNNKSKDLRIELDMTWEGKVKNRPFGLAFCSETGNRYYLFLISAEGYFCVAEYPSSSHGLHLYREGYRLLIPWKNSQYINKAPVTRNSTTTPPSNSLTVARLSGNYYFFANEKCVTWVSADSLSETGSYFGMWVEGRQKIKFTRLTLSNISDGDNSIRIYKRRLDSAVKK